MTTDYSGEIYLGSRGADFKSLIVSLLERGRLKPKYIEVLTSGDSLKAYGQAFTAESADPVNNYERFEQVGDVTANKFIVWYAYKRFPQLDCTEGVKIVARLRINYGAKETFAPLAEQLGFWKFISAEEDGMDKNKKYRARNKKDLLEDTFEAFVGCTEYLLDKAYRPGVGYGIVYDILSDIFDQIPISLRFEDLMDPKTRLKETFDAFPHLGDWAFVSSREKIDNGYTVALATLYQVPPGISNKPGRQKTGPGKKDFTECPLSGWIPLGKGTASKKIDAHQKAAAEGIETLRSKGFYREPPADYAKLCVNPSERESPDPE